MHNFPSEPSHFLGRHEEISEIITQLADPACRLLTLIGPGGIGKTRLAVEAAKRMSDQFAHGVYFINFQPITSPDQVVSTITDAINMPLSRQEDLQTLLLKYVVNKEMLLVLDNFEQLLGSTPLLSDLLRIAPGIKLLVTSREALNLQEEWLFPVRGMPFPATDDAAALENFSAVQLFVERARRVDRSFSLSAERRGVVRICRVVEGLPLALELAAVWTKVLPCAEIAKEIQRNLDFLATSIRNVSERHRSMHAVFAQTWEQLTVDERSVFRKLSVFRGGFRREAAEKVADASLRTLSALVDKSLLARTPAGRYQIHELLRQYAEAELQRNAEEAHDVQGQHSTYFTDFLNNMADDLNTGRPLEASEEVAADIDNIRIAWQQAVARMNIAAIEKAAWPLHIVYQYHNWYREGLDVFGKAVHALENAAQHGKAYALTTLALGWYRLRVGQIDDAGVAFQTAHTILQSLKIFVPVQAGEPLAGMSLVAVVQGDYARAITLAEQGCQECEARADIQNLAYAYYAWASAAQALGDYDAAREHARHSCTIARSINLIWFLAYGLNTLGDATSALGNYVEARQHYQESYTLREAFGDAEGMALALNNLGKIAFLDEDYRQTRELYQKSHALYRDLGDRGGLASVRYGLGCTASAFGEYSIAQRCFHEALQGALDAQLIPLALSFLIGISDLFLKTGDKQRAAELLALALNHPGSIHDTKQQARQRLAHTPQASQSADDMSTDFEALAHSLLDVLSVEREFNETGQSTDWALIEPLSARELEVLRLIAQGLSNAEIAQLLFISIATVKVHAGNIFGKLGVSNRTQAVMQAQKLNLL